MPSDSASPMLGVEPSGQPLLLSPVSYCLKQHCPIIYLDIIITDQQKQVCLIFLSPYSSYTLTSSWCLLFFLCILFTWNGIQMQTKGRDYLLGFKDQWFRHGAWRENTDIEVCRHVIKIQTDGMCRLKHGILNGSYVFQIRFGPKESLRGSFYHLRKTSLFQWWPGNHAPFVLNNHVEFLNPLLCTVSYAEIANLASDSLGALCTIMLQCSGSWLSFLCEILLNKSSPASPFHISRCFSLLDLSPIQKSLFKVQIRGI